MTNVENSEEVANFKEPVNSEDSVKSEEIVRHCPKCGSIRVHRSRRRGPFESLMAAVGASICRCHDCRARQAWFGLSPIPIGNTVPEANPWAGILLLISGFAVSLALVWVAVMRYSRIAG